MSKIYAQVVHFATFYLQIEATMVASRFHGFRFHGFMVSGFRVSWFQGFRFQLVRLRMVDELNCQMEANVAEEPN